MGVTDKNRAVFDRLIKSIDGMDKLGNLDDPIQAAVIQFINKLKLQLQEDGTYASGNLAQSIKPLFPFEKSQGVLKIRIELNDYWKDVNDGTKPKGFTKEARNKLAPQLYYWLQEKPQLLAIAKTKSQQRSLSYAIATNILKKGTIKRFGYKGTGFVTNNMAKFKADIIKQLEEAYTI